ncbi:MAG: voltage-gated potassium channel protein [Acidobacteriota bacterium]|nr:voltage-gated potassium channel protein [Acidobacteriota bacterium]
MHWSFAPGRLQRLRLFGRRLADRLAAAYWFPHLPLALAVAGAGLLLLSHTFGAGRQALLADFPFHVLNVPPASMPYLLLGLAMPAMSIGLAFRSRFAWVVALVLTVAMILVLTLLRLVAYPLLLNYDAALLAALLLARRAFDRTSLAAATLFAVASSLLLLIYAVFGSFYLGAEFSPRIGDLSTALYYSMVTMSTVGYGDITPRTVHARLFTVSLILFGVAVFATSITAIIGPMVSGSLQRIMTQKRTRMKRSDHYIIVGATALAFNTYRELKRRKHQVTLILPQAQTEADDLDAEDVIVGDANSLEILRRADADRAQAVLAMRADDSENAFIVLAVKELKGKAKTVAAINDSKHVERMKLVQPDIVIAPQVLGGELLAMALSGEAIDGDFVMDRFLHFDRRN